MAKSLAVGATVVALPEDLLWSDEHDWSAVDQVSERSITGALVVNAGLKVGGRPITLQSPDEGSAWITGAALAQLKAWAQLPLQNMTLVLGATTRTVMYRHEDGALQAFPVVDYSDIGPDDYYTITLRLTDVTP